jgi:hypothetical protein
MGIKSDVKRIEQKMSRFNLKGMMLERFWDWSIVSTVIFDGVSVDLKFGLVNVWLKVELVEVKSEDRLDDILLEK